MKTSKIYPWEIERIADELQEYLEAACALIADAKERERIFAAIVIDILEFQEKDCPAGTHFVTAGIIFSAGVGGLTDDPMEDRQNSTLIKAATAWYLLSGEIR